MEAQIEQILNTKRRPNETWRDVFNRLEPSGRVDMKALINLMALVLNELEVRLDDANGVNEDLKVLFERTNPQTVVHHAAPKPTPKPKTKK